MRLIVEILIPLFPLIIELKKDINQYTRTGTVDHKLGIANRLVFAALFAMFLDPTIIGLQIAYHVLIFDHVMGYVIAENPFYLGKTSKIDRMIRKWPNSTILTLRILIAGFASSIYFFEDQWLNLF